ncbi:MAG: glycerol-3-phosphate 1-O-acyltransferase PlsY [Oscillospiraceae bacterium]|nr:glycerol-3-phosphate 1-O-acyltransferase PlsY [Oscillospiraceae bacterium]
MKYILAAVIAYLLGSVCSSIPLSKRCKGVDIRTKGSGNAGATNVARVFGIRAGFITLGLDMAKTVAAMLIGQQLCGVMGEAISGAFCIIGHCFPLYFGFKGGKGVSVGAALGLMTGLPVFAVIIAVFLVTAFASRKVSLGSILAAVTLPVASLIFNAPTPLLAMNAFSAVLVVLMHRENIRRLINGTEGDFKPGKSC